MTTAQVVDKVLEEYAVTREQATYDCSRVLQFAAEKTIIKEVNNT